MEKAMLFFGSSIVTAIGMNRAEYNDYRGWQLPENENGSDDGFLVVDPSGPKNDDRHDGYIQWLPVEVFHNRYRTRCDMNFGDALAALKLGHRVARAGWNGKDMFLFLVQGSTFKVNRPPLLGIYEEGTEINYHAHIDMRTATGEIVPWLASQSDMLANDWQTIL